MSPEPGGSSPDLSSLEQVAGTTAGMEIAPIKEKAFEERAPASAPAVAQGTARPDCILRPSESCRNRERCNQNITA